MGGFLSLTIKIVKLEMRIGKKEQSFSTPKLTKTRNIQYLPTSFLEYHSLTDFEFPSLELKKLAGVETIMANTELSTSARIEELVLQQIMVM